MHDNLLDKLDKTEIEEPTSYDYALLYAKYVGVCVVFGGAILLVMYYGLVEYPLNRVVGLALAASAILLFLFALIGGLHSIRSYWRKEDVSRVRAGVALLHILVVLMYLGYLLVTVYAVVHLNPTAI